VTKREATNSSGRRQTRGRGRRLFGGYVRVSSIGAREDERLRSPDFQAELIDRAAGAAGVDVRMYEPELDVSGSRRQRAILDGLVRAIEDGELDGIIVAKLDRLSRLAPKDRLELVERIEAAGGEILSASEAFDTSSPEGRFVRELFFSLARLEWERFAGAWTTAKANAVAGGVSISNRAAFGYRFDRDHRLVRHPVEAAVVGELFELRAGGASWSRLLEHFEQRTGRRTARQTMSQLVRSRVYLGEVAYGELVNAGAHQPLVELDLFETVQRVNRERAGDGGRRHAGAPVSLLGGIATCASCGRPLAKHARSHQRARYECRSPRSHCAEPASVVEEELDEHVWQEILAWAGAAADEVVELELELDARGDRIVAEHRLAAAERLALEYELDVEVELEIGREAFAVGRRARLDVVELRRQELEACGQATEHELARTTLRQAVQSHDLEPDEARRLLRVVLTGVVVRRMPRRPVDERAKLLYAVPLVEEALTEPRGQDGAELREKTPA
jgi:DNA invertase Pin-like site-specific DNA recombinase